MAQVRVTRPFLLAGVRQESGSVIDVPDSVARELAHMGKAEQISAAPAAGAMTTDNTAALVPGRAVKGVKHADK